MSALRKATLLCCGLAGCGQVAEVQRPQRFDPVEYCATAKSPKSGPGDDRLVVRVPKVRYEALATYPAARRLAHEGGVVVLHVLVSPDGAVEKVKVLDSAGPDFDAVAADALLKFAFAPACSATGTPLRIAIIYKYRFCDSPLNCR